jgi:hypothetical protein
MDNKHASKEGLMIKIKRELQGIKKTYQKNEMEQLVIHHTKFLKYNLMKYCVKNNHNIH